MSTEEAKAENDQMKAVEMLARDLAKNVGRVWHLGDGYGGLVKDALRNAIEARGLQWEPPASDRKNRRSPIPRHVRDEVITRDGLVCRYCNVPISPKAVTIDHRIPISKGGQSTVENLCVCCGPCNSSKGAR